MSRLIVEEGSQRRAFQMGEGTLTIGSGAAATLKLASPGVAEIHAELELRGGKARLRPRPGVLPPLVEGTQVTREVELQSGASFTIGEARLRLELPGAPAAPAPAPAPVAQAAPAPVVRRPAAGAALQRSGAGRSGSAGRSDSAGRSGSRREREQEAEPARRSRPRQRSMKPYFIIGGALGLLLIAYLLRDLFFYQPAVAGPREILMVARAELAQGDYEQAAGRLTSIPPAAFNDIEFKKSHDALVAEINAARATSKQLDFNVEGTRYLQTQLENFEKNYLKSDIDKSKVRVFLQRAAEFKRRWPTHEKIDWVERQEARFRSMVDLSQPPDFADVAFEVKALTWSDTRDYKAAFQVLDAFIQRSTGEERGKALALVEEKKAERAAWYEDRLLQARYEYDKQQFPKSVAILVTILTKSGDQAMADRAADELLRFDTLDEWLRGYKQSQPEVLAKMLEHPRIAEFAKGVTDL